MLGRLCGGNGIHGYRIGQQYKRLGRRYRNPFTTWHMHTLAFSNSTLYVHAREINASANQRAYITARWHPCYTAGRRELAVQMAAYFSLLRLERQDSACCSRVDKCRDYPSEQGLELGDDSQSENTYWTSARTRVQIPVSMQKTWCYSGVYCNPAAIGSRNPRTAGVFWLLTMWSRFIEKPYSKGLHQSNRTGYQTFY